MASKQVIAVFGATGNQGGSVVDVFLADPALSAKWQIRAITRDPTKESSKALAARGVEVVAGNQDDKASLVKALEGAHTVFAVTDYWATFSLDAEVRQGKNMADAAAQVGVQHYIWSTLLDINKLSNGVLPHIYHFDGKAQVDEHIKALGLPHSFFLPGMFMSNLSGGMMMRRDAQNNDNGFILANCVPASAVSPYLDTRADTGKWIRGIVNEGPRGQRVYGATARYSFQDVLDTFKRVFPEEGARAKFVELPKDVYQGILQSSGMPEVAAVEMVENMRLLDEFEYFGGAPLDESVKLAGGIGELTSLEQHFRNAPAFKDLK